MLTPAQAAEVLRVSPSLIYAWCREGRLKHRRFGRAGKRGTIRIDPADLSDLANECVRDGAARDDGPLKHIR